MPLTPGAVTAGDLLDALAALGSPTRLLTDAAPGDADLPQLLGAVCGAVDKVIAHTRMPLTGDARRAWAAGYLQTVGARAGACGARRAFDLLAMRLQLFENLLEGYSGVGPAVQLTRACLAAAASYAVVAATGHAIRDGALQPDDALTELTRAQADGARDALQQAVRLDGTWHKQLTPAAPA